MKLSEPFAEWAILELMGHRRLAGRVTEQVIAGAAFLRLDVPTAAGDGWEKSQLYAPAAIYAIHPVAEDIARSCAKRWTYEPVARFELAALGPKSVPWADDQVECEDEDDHEDEDDPDSDPDQA